MSGTFWKDDIGLCAWQPYILGPSYAITQMDGLTHIRGGTQAGMTNWFQFSIEQGSYNIYTVDGFLQNVYRFDYYVGSITTLLVGGGVINQFADCDVLCPDRWLTALRYNDATMKVRYKPIDGSVDWVVEATIADIPTRAGATGKCTWSKTENNDEFYIISEGGSAIRYNATTKTFDAASLKLLPVNRKAWYSPRFDVFIVLFADNTVAVYAAAPQPAALTAPVAVPNLTRAQVCTVRTQLLGADGEACPNELIDWTLTAGDGELLTAQSTTDADGYATAQYLAPMTGGTNPTIAAEMRF
jgi:hypothetical protein